MRACGHAHRALQPMITPRVTRPARTLAAVSVQCTRPRIFAEGEILLIEAVFGREYRVRKHIDPLIFRVLSKLQSEPERMVMVPVKTIRGILLQKNARFGQSEIVAFSGRLENGT